jgi:hypothetical protein
VQSGSSATCVAAVRPSHVPPGFGVQSRSEHGQLFARVQTGKPTPVSNVYRARNMRETRPVPGSGDVTRPVGRSW